MKYFKLMLNLTIATFFFLSSVDALNVSLALANVPQIDAQVEDTESAEASQEESSELDEAEQDQWTVIHAGTLIVRPGEPYEQNKSVIIKNDRIDAVRADLPSLSGPTLLLESAFGFSGVMPPSPYKAA